MALNKLVSISIITFIVMIIVLILSYSNNVKTREEYLKYNQTHKHLNSSLDIINARKLLIQIQEAENRTDLFNLCMKDAVEFIDTKSSQIYVVQYCKARVRRFLSLPETVEEVKKIKELANKPLPKSIIYLPLKDQ